MTKSKKILKCVSCLLAVVMLCGFSSIPAMAKDDSSVSIQSTIVPVGASEYAQKISGIMLAGAVENSELYNVSFNNSYLF